MFPNFLKLQRVSIFNALVPHSLGGPIYIYSLEKCTYFQNTLDLLNDKFTYSPLEVTDRVCKFVPIQK